MTGDDVADVAVTCAGFDAIDASPQALQGNLEQMLRFFVNILGLARSTVSFKSPWYPKMYAVTSILTMSPFSNGRVVGIP